MQLNALFMAHPLLIWSLIFISQVYWLHHIQWASGWDFNPKHYLKALQLCERWEISAVRYFKESSKELSVFEEVEVQEY